MYPSSRVVEVGSNTTFCCIIAEGDSFGKITYHARDMDITRLSRRSYATTRTNQGPSASSGTNVVCSNSKTVVTTGAVMFVGCKEVNRTHTTLLYHHTHSRQTGVTPDL